MSKATPPPNGKGKRSSSRRRTRRELERKLRRAGVDVAELGDLTLDELVDVLGPLELAGAIESSAGTNGSTAASSHAVTLPATVSPGALLLIFGRVTGAGTVAITGGGWTIAQDSSDASDDVTFWAYKSTAAVGNEDGTTVTVTHGASLRLAAVSLSVTGAADPAVTPPQASTVAVGTGTSANPTSLSPTGGSKDYRWLYLLGTEGEPATWPPATPPTNYTSVASANTGTAGAVGLNCAVAVWTRATTAASEDPPAVTIPSEDWAAWTIGIHPAPLALESADLVAVYDVRQLEQQDLVAVYDVRQLEAADLVAQYDVGRYTLSVPIASGAGDGWAARSSSPADTWPPSTEIEDANAAATFVYVRKVNHVTFGFVELSNGLLNFDTSALPDDAALVSAELRFRVESLGGGGGGLAMPLNLEWYGIGAAIDNADYTVDVPATAGQVAAATWQAWVADQDVVIPLSNVTGVSKTGMTGLRLGMQGTPNTGSDNDTLLAFHAFENTESHPPAELVVVYTAPLVEQADLVAVYDVRQLEAADLAAVYDVRTLESADLVAQYDVRQLEQQDLAAVYDVRALELADLVAVYDVRTLEAADLAAVYDVLTLEQADLVAVYDVQALGVEQADLVAQYDVRALEAADLAAVYDVQALAGRNLTAVYDVRQLEATDLAAVYDVRQLELADLAAVYDVLQLAPAEDIVAVYDVRQLERADLVAVYDVVSESIAGANLIAVYDVIAHEQAELVVAYDVLQLEQQQLVATYDVRALELADLTAVYDVRALAGRNLTALYDVRALARRDLVAVYDVRQLELAQLVATYDVLVLDGDFVVAVYDVRELAPAADLTAVYDVQALESADLVAVYDVLSLIRAPITRRTRAVTARTGATASRLAGSGGTMAVVEREGVTRA